MTNTNRFDQVLDTLLRAREWLSDPDRWSASGCGDVDHDWLRYSSTCLGMAIFQTTWDQDDDDLPVWGHAEGKDALDYLESLLQGEVSRFNDSHTHPEVLALLDRAIDERTSELAEAQA